MRRGSKGQSMQCFASEHSSASVDVRESINQSDRFDCQCARNVGFSRVVCDHPDRPCPILSWAKHIPPEVRVQRIYLLKQTNGARSTRTCCDLEVARFSDNHFEPTDLHHQEPNRAALDSLRKRIISGFLNDVDHGVSSSFVYDLSDIR